MKRRKKVQLLSLCGVIISAYAFYVESKMDDPFYQPSCSSSWTGGNCVTVFKSPYGHILSHWGVVERGSILDLSLAVSGLMLYSCYFLAISVKVPFPLREELFLGVALGGGLFSLYLLYVIKFILQEFCIVCFSFHCCNFGMLALALLEYRAPEVGSKRSSKAD
mmetsp:Transcript_17166/g.32361  ORF Transcript_17166/g.32361 Transcript_17166/m.32361 type:complete len:164 (+) Transcript_17166:123-614(+)